MTQLMDSAPATASADDPLASSADTWLSDPTPEPGVPEILLHRGGGPVQRLMAWRERHRIREHRARSFFAASRRPERGLPVAGDRAVITFVRGMLADRRRLVIALVVVNALAGAVGLVVPRLLGDLVNRATSGEANFSTTLNRLALTVLVIVVVQGALTFAARWVSSVFGQDLLATAREHVVRTVLRLPLSKLESASTGDLVTRVTRDVSSMSGAVRWALPQLVIASVLFVLTMGAMVLNSLLLTVPALLGLVVLVFVVRRYLARAPMGYITEGGTYSVINTSLTESVEGARTVEALGIERQRRELTARDVAVSAQAERYTMSLRNLMFVYLDYVYQGPLAFIILVGAWGYHSGWITLGQITAAALYTQQLVEPMDRLIQTLDRLQVGMASTTRLLGIAEVPQDRTPGDRRPVDNHLVGRDLRFAYREGHDVLHGIELDLRPGERLAIVGPSGSGKSTLGRLLAGINAPRTGEVAVGGVDVMSLPLDLLRTEVALVTQEHHVFVGSIRDNIVLAREDTATDEEVRLALAAVEAGEWVDRLPLGMNTQIGSGHLALTPAQAQQVALARLVIADPHTLVLDEATSLIDPRTARHLEGSMAALLSGRAVVAIAHRLHTAHDADRIAVVIDGRIAELGSHDDLLRLDREYAALWRAWTS